MIEVSVLPAFLLAFLLISVAPGPDMAFVVASGLGGGPAAGAMAALGMAAGMVVHTLLASFGLAAVLETAPASLDVIRLLGATYLAYLAAVTLSSASTTGLHQPTPQARTVFRRAAITNLTNAKIILFFAAFLPQFVRYEAGSLGLQFAVLGVLFLLVGLVVDISFGLAAGRVRRTLEDRPRLAVVLNVLSGLTYAAIALSLALSVLPR